MIGTETIIKTKLTLYTDGDWYIDYKELYEYRNLLLAIENDSGILKLTYSHHIYDGGVTDEDIQSALSKVVSIANEVFLLKEHKGTADIYELFPTLKIGKQSNGNYDLKVKVSAKTKAYELL